jgi:hypothetical protein
MAREYYEQCCCGSGQPAYPVRDTDGVLVTYACDSCREERLEDYSDLCPCGSGKTAYVVRDAKGAAIALACDSCREERLKACSTTSCPERSETDPRSR